MTARTIAQFAAVILMIGLSGSTFAGDFEEAVAAHKRGDFAAFISNLTKAAEQGHAEAQYSLGVAYSKGIGVAKDYEQAVYWFLKAAEQGFASAQYNLGFVHAEGRGVAKDYKQAVYWYLKAAEQGDADAQHNLALMYNKGEGVPRDDKRASLARQASCADSVGTTSATPFRSIIASESGSVVLCEPGSH